MDFEDFQKKKWIFICIFYPYFAAFSSNFDYFEKILKYFHFLRHTHIFYM